MEIVRTMGKKLCTLVPLLDNVYTVDFTIIISLYLLWINTFLWMNTSLVWSKPYTIGESYKNSRIAQYYNTVIIKEKQWAEEKQAQVAAQRNSVTL